MLIESSNMKARDTAELLLIATATAAAWFLRPSLPAQMAFGELILAAAVLLLAQGLIRDLYVKFSARRVEHATQASGTPKRGIFCMCMESTLGVVGIVAGAALLLSGISARVQLPSFFWPGCILITCLFGFIIKNYVLDWQTWPWRIRREENHSSVVFW